MFSSIFNEAPKFAQEKSMHENYPNFHRYWNSKVKTEEN